MNDSIDSFQGEFRFLSNFWFVRIQYLGLTFLSTEHAYQAAKTLDRNAHRKIAQAATASEAKRLGRRVSIRPEWEEVKLDVMYELVKQKFNLPHIGLRGLLLATGDRELIEGNHWGDTFWGVCAGEGQNHLGKILMRVRAELHAESGESR